MNIAVIFAGGVGERMGSETPKQFIKIENKPILIHTLELFEKHNDIDEIYIVMLNEYISYTRELVEKYKIKKVIDIISGGKTALDSIYKGLLKAREDNNDDDIVLIHDGVRPYITEQTITNNIEGVKEYGNAITTTACFETIIISKDGEKVLEVPYRKEMFAAQAPQSFFLGKILKAHSIIREREEKYGDLVDNCGLIRELRIEPHMVKGNRGNIKATTPEDVAMIEALLKHNTKN